MSDLGIALAGGAIGSVLTVGFGQIGVARAAWAGVELHDAEARETNALLLAWVMDRTTTLARELKAIKEDFNGRNVFYSSMAADALADAKAQALKEYREEERRARIELARMKATEGIWHQFWRVTRRRILSGLTVKADIEPYLKRWREPITSPGTKLVPLDLSGVTRAEATSTLERLDFT